MAKAVLYIDNTMTYGGAILSLKNLLNALDAQRFEPVVTTGQTDDYLKKDYAQFRCYRLDIKLPWVHDTIYRKIIRNKASRLPVIKQVITLCRFLYWIVIHHIPDAVRYYRIGKRHEVKIVHLNNIMGSQLPGILAAKMLNVPCVAHLRDFERVTFITKTYARLINHHIAISTAIKNNLLALGIPEGKITIVHDSIDIDEFSPEVVSNELYEEFQVSRDALKFGLFGRIVEWKGVREFIKAATLALVANKSAVAFIVGSAPDADDPYFREIKNLIDELGMNNRIVLTGYRRDVACLMNFMDLIVHTSITAEPFGMVVIEGMALAKPVIATAAGGPLDIVIDGDTGLLVPLGQVEALSMAITKLLNNPKQMELMGEAGRKRVKKTFSSKNSAQKIEQIYSKLLFPESQQERI